MARGNINVMRSDSGLNFEAFDDEKGYRSPKTISKAARAAIDLFSMEGA
ncbi:hypothetical protein IJG91_00405 [Candidatus Saccharibacteria bacterium]|nr:hypothetical protein [Candidatus Saccharibacteria bacterium]